MTPRTSLPDAALTGLRSDFAGEVHAPGDPGYDEARTVFNGMIDRRPAVVAQCATRADVARALALARDRELEVAVRGGGHSVAGMALSEGGLVIDLRRMSGVDVDRDARSVRVGGGAVMSDLDRATQPHSLATTGGRVSTTGVGGFTLGGGSGWLERKFGLACDNLLAADVVTADGGTVRASADENPELFWALHGGGGNFGVVTSLTLRLHDLPAMSMVMLLFRPEDGPEVVGTYRDVMERAPDEAGGACIYITGPPEEWVPEALVGHLVCAALITFAGTEAQARDVAAPLLALKSEAEVVDTIPYADLQCLLDDPPGMRNHWSAEYLNGFPDEAVAAFCGSAGTLPVPTNTQHVLFPMGGAVARGPADYPLPWRSSPWAVHPFGVWESEADDERVRQWVRGVRSAMMPWANGAVYLNFIGREGQERVMAGFGEDAYERLSRVKARFDPDNVFHLNHNVKPAVAMV
ncbi:FAD-binding oxidoreductase [Streptomyces sp. HB132]|uniref:FAD-binding oxidoreductase n=1 Tax=Streptomyces sp. HB132 TaxID=767388 RepID=UPI001960CCA9|nr:FAD-binding oxidoreductase [Streptomyces sp. HB132]MBM7442061.1 FAD/FMN-containing dehydrogenase [Streptomyces sp. HB132]